MTDDHRRCITTVSQAFIQDFVSNKYILTIYRHYPPCHRHPMAMGVSSDCVQRVSFGRLHRAYDRSYLRFGSAIRSISMHCRFIPITICKEYTVRYVFLHIPHCLCQLQAVFNNEHVALLANSSSSILIGTGIAFLSL